MVFAAMPKTSGPGVSRPAKPPGWPKMAGQQQPGSAVRPFGLSGGGYQQSPGPGQIVRRGGVAPMNEADSLENYFQTQQGTPNAVAQASLQGLQTQQLAQAQQAAQATQPHVQPTGWPQGTAPPADVINQVPHIGKWQQQTLANSVQSAGPDGQQPYVAPWAQQTMAQSGYSPGTSPWVHMQQNQNQATQSSPQGGSPTGPPAPLGGGVGQGPVAGGAQPLISGSDTQLAVNQAMADGQQASTSPTYHSLRGISSQSPAIQSGNVTNMARSLADSWGESEGIRTEDAQANAGWSLGNQLARANDAFGRTNYYGIMDAANRGYQTNMGGLRARAEAGMASNRANLGNEALDDRNWAAQHGLANQQANAAHGLGQAGYGANMDAMNRGYQTSMGGMRARAEAGMAGNRANLSNEAMDDQAWWANNMLGNQMAQGQGNMDVANYMGGMGMDNQGYNNQMDSLRMRAMMSLMNSWGLSGQQGTNMDMLANMMYWQ